MRFGGYEICLVTCSSRDNIILFKLMPKMFSITQRFLNCESRPRMGLQSEMLELRKFQLFQL